MHQGPGSIVYLKLEIGNSRIATVECYRISHYSSSLSSSFESNYIVIAINLILSGDWSCDSIFHCGIVH